MAVQYDNVFFRSMLWVWNSPSPTKVWWYGMVLYSILEMLLGCFYFGLLLLSILVGGVVAAKADYETTTQRNTASPNPAENHPTPSYTFHTSPLEMWSGSV